MAHLGQPSCRSASLVTMWLLVACSADGAEEVSLLDAGARGPAVLVFYGDTTAVRGGGPALQARAHPAPAE